MDGILMALIVGYLGLKARKALASGLTLFSQSMENFLPSITYGAIKR